MKANKLTPTNTVIQKKSFMWSKQWVRPYESLWSIMHNFRIVNHCSRYQDALKLLGLSDKHLLVPRYDSRWGIFNTLSDKLNDYEVVDKQLIPEGYSNYFNSINKAMKSCPYFISSQLRYCPECMKQGYHSILHQLSGVEYCPFHKQEKLKVYLNDSYIFGSIKKYEGNKGQMDSYRAMLMRNLELYSTFDFENLELFPLPIV